MSDSELENIERWLNSLPVSLWGKFYYITEGDGRERAAKWFYSQILAFLDWKQNQDQKQEQTQP